MSWPAACAYGPSWPQPVMRPYTSFGLRVRQASGPIPSRSATPGRNPSMSASACSTMRRTVSTPSGCFRSTPIERRPRFNTSIHPGSNPRSTDWARSTRTTSAPMSESSIAANGPGPMPAISITLTPDSGPTSLSSVAILCRGDTTPTLSVNFRARPGYRRAMPTIQSIIPLLVYEDIERAHDFLVDSFGFGAGGVERAGDGQAVHGEVVAGDHAIWLHRVTPEHELASPHSMKAQTGGLVVRVDDVDAHYARARAAGAHIDQEPIDQPYGQREYGVRDPEGHRWWFAT